MRRLGGIIGGSELKSLEPGWAALQRQPHVHPRGQPQLHLVMLLQAVWTASQDHYEDMKSRTHVSNTHTPSQSNDHDMFLLQ